MTKNNNNSVSKQLASSNQQPITMIITIRQLMVKCACCAHKFIHLFWCVQTLFFSLHTHTRSILTFCFFFFCASLFVSFHCYITAHKFIVKRTIDRIPVWKKIIWRREREKERKPQQNVIVLCSSIMLFHAFYLLQWVHYSVLKSEV